jgi:plastocyanin
MKNLTKTGRSAVILLLSCIGLSSCSSSSAPENATGAEEKRIWPVVHHVEINGMKFVPEELNVRKGDSVVWTNKDIVIHDVTEVLTTAWTSRPIASGASWGMKVNQSADYYCSIHKVMKGKLIIP